MLISEAQKLADSIAFDNLMNNSQWISIGEYNAKKLKSTNGYSNASEIKNKNKTLGGLAENDLVRSLAYELNDYYFGNRDNGVS